MYLYDQIPLRTGAISVYPYSPALEKLFTVVPKYDEPFSMADKVGNTLHVPRELVPVGKEDFRVAYPLVAIDCQIQPVDEEQAECITRSVYLLRNGKNHILEAPTGWGKTFAGISIACRLGQPTLILVTKEDLIRAWKKAIHAAGYTDAAIGRIQADKCIWQGKQFVIAMVQSFMDFGEKYPADMYQYFGLQIFDEVHRMGADKFSIASRLFPAKYRLGLSATPDRKDGKMPVIEAHIGKTMVRGKLVPMQPKILVKKTGWQVPKVSYPVKTANGWKKEFGPLPIVPGRMMPVYKLMAEDYARNSVITEFVTSAYKAGRNIVVMSDLSDHLKGLFHRFAKAGIPGEEMGYYIGGLSETALEANAHKRIVLATYKMCAEGTNYPIWDTLILCTPHADVKQALGRILRKLPGKKEPVALDLVDNEKILKSFYHTREKQYYSVKANIVRMD
jgi:superfamily II DNA or RNA helicase